MSLKQDLQKLVNSALDLVAELPATQQRRGLEIGFDKVNAALSELPNDASMEDVKEAVAKEFEKTTPFSETDQKKTFNNEQPEGTCAPEAPSEDN